MAGDADTRFKIEQAVTIVAGGAVTEDCIALDTGPVEVVASHSLETDAEQRIRRKGNLQFSRSRSVEAIRSAILARNDNAIYPAFGLPGMVRELKEPVCGPAFLPTETFPCVSRNPDQVHSRLAG